MRLTKVTAAPCGWAVFPIKAPNPHYDSGADEVAGRMARTVDALKSASACNEGENGA